MTRFLLKSSVLFVASAAAVLSCRPVETEETAAPQPVSCVPKEGPLPHEHLTDYCFFEGELRYQVPADGVVPFEVAAPLWSDHAEKRRFIVLPEGQKIKVTAGEDWQYPTGTVLIKSFAFRDDFGDPASARRILETRLLMLGETGWTGEVYRWNDEQTEATRIVAGERVDVTFKDEAGETFTEEYIVPNQNQCKSCHERDDEVTFLGPFTHQLNRPVVLDGEQKNQLGYLAEKGLFDSPLPAPESLPAFPNPAGDAPIEERARAYLHANCSHCHRPGGGGGPSGLVLLAWETEPAKNGVCKDSAAAGAGTGGFDHDIVPGHPEESIMIFRMSSTDPEIKMPELPNRIPDKFGVGLVSEWISGMAPPGCP